MYPVTELFLQKIKETNRLVKMEIKIQHDDGILELTDNDLVLGSLSISEFSQPGEDFIVGGAVASKLSFSIFNKDEYENIDFTDAVIRPYFNLLVKEGADAHFLQPSQPSKMPGFEDEWETVPLGVYNVDKPNRQINTIELKAVDNMLKFELPYSLSKLSYPANLYQILVNACNVCDIQLASHNFPNMNYVVQGKPSGEYSFRDIIRFVAELSGTFARMNRLGALELKWYEPTGITIGPENRENLKVGDGILQIKGVMATKEDKTYLVGTDEYTIDLSENPLLQGDYLNVLNNVFINIKNIAFMPYSSNWQGNPALQPGDTITQVDRLGKSYPTLITDSTFKYRGKSALHAKGLPIISKRYNPNGKLVAKIMQKVDEQVGDKLTTLEEQILISTDLIANMLGGYAIKTDEALYVADNKDLSKAVKVWKWGIGGFGYSQNGVNGPYTTAITADGSIVAMLVAANIITANMVQTGILQSNNGLSYFNLDTGILHIGHGSSNIYSQMDTTGFYIQYPYGKGQYLTDFEIIEHTQVSNQWVSSEPNPIRIYLPQRFRGRQIRALPVPRGFESYTEMPIAPRDPATMSYTRLKVDLINTNSNNSTPYVDVVAMIVVRDDTNRRILYSDIEFNLTIVGM
jgi:hypothetical protein